MRVCIYRDEAYPVYSLYRDLKPFDETIEISVWLYEEYKSVESSYKAMQAKLAALYDRQEVM